jgi:hypothetical protein
MIVDVVNPKTGQRWHMDVPVHPAVFEAAKRDLALSQHVADLALPQLPAGFMLCGELATP